MAQQPESRPTSQSVRVTDETGFKTRMQQKMQEIRENIDNFWK